MAEGMLLAIAQKIIEDLGSWAFQEVGSLWDVEAELENIKNTLSTIQAVLQDAAEQQSHNHQVRDWLEKLKDAVYEADDLLSEFLTEALRRGGTSENIAKKKLNAIAEDRKKFHLKECHVEPHVSMDREETHSFVPNENVLGREDDKKAIIKLLLDPNVEENVSVVPIVGIGGLGKTTLAQYVYNDDIVKKHFELKMWVCVSDPFEVKVVIEKIIASATSNKPNDLHMDELQKQLRKEIDGKKYLLVLDDVWNQNYNKWDNLKSLLMGGAKGSKDYNNYACQIGCRDLQVLFQYTLLKVCLKTNLGLYLSK
uniref:Rx N-terminal domain-containing protein n=1 Tax=Fagus sylvatica TaxID=28930 RepID=A0A2N9I2Z6_FAGSY